MIELITMRQFILACEALPDISDAYDLFEDYAVPTLRAWIYTFADPASPEPFRSAMHTFGFYDY